MNQPHDGYTLFIGASGVMSVAAAAYPNLSYHPTKTFIPLSMIANFPLILVIPPDHPAKTVKELVEWAKKNPDKANYASTSPAFITATELLKLKSGMPGQMIPYKSSNEMILSVMQGQTLLAISDGPPAMPQIKAGKVKAIAVTGSTRSAELPDVPSMAEAGYPEVNTKLWSGYFAPVNTPPAIVAKLEAGLRKAITDPGVSDKLKAMAVTPGGNVVGRFPQDDRRGHQELPGRDQGGEPEVRQLAPPPIRTVLMPRHKRGMIVLAAGISHRFRQPSLGAARADAASCGDVEGACARRSASWARDRRG